jgi:1,2-phenylacetyl-CoA epoxidase catalytic subunit
MTVSSTTSSLSAVDECLRDELYCIADSMLVLGGWYMIVLPNGRAISDWSAMCAMMQGQYGHARALYQYLGRFGVTREEAEWTRGARDIRSPKLLDHPPQSWSDFVATIFLAEQAITTQLGAYRNGTTDRTLARLADKVHRESRFHISYASGWIKALRKDPSSTIDTDIRRRFAEAVDWWGSASDASDSLFKAGYRNEHDADLFQRFTRVVETELEMAPGAAKAEGRWDDSVRRHGVAGIPETLFQIIRFKNHELALP